MNEETMKPSSKHSEIILAGTGGQGLILSGMMLAEAAILEPQERGADPVLRHCQPGACRSLK